MPPTALQAISDKPKTSILAHLPKTYPDVHVELAAGTHDDLISPTHHIAVRGNHHDLVASGHSKPESRLLQQFPTLFCLLHMPATMHSGLLDFVHIGIDKNTHHFTFSILDRKPFQPGALWRVWLECKMWLAIPLYVRIMLPVMRIAHTPALDPFSGATALPSKILVSLVVLPKPSQLLPV